MPQAHFEIYRAQVFKLAKTLVFKSLATALTINNELKAIGLPVSDEDYHSWKYYRNLAGQYHSSDTLMTVTSLDTLQTIEFTVENLQQHRATAAGYAFGSRYYEELVSRYPAQENLILRILDPIDIDVAIAADDGEILWYDASLVEENETNFIPRVQDYLNNLFSRWDVTAYQLTDDLYVPALLAMVYNFLPIAIMNIRNGNCHTRYAHSFHIKEFLTSHGNLTEFLDFLTKKQLLWLYRNIRYIHRHPGRQDTLDWLIENILTPRGIPLAQWDMVHNLHGQPDDLYPEVLFERTPLNFGYNLNGADTKTIDEMLDDELDLAKGNPRVRDEVEVEMRQDMSTSIRNHFQTKVLESNMIDWTDAVVFPFADFVLNHWLYLSQNNRYNTFINFDDPRTGEPTIMSVRDAFTVFLYTYNRSNNITLLEIPEIEAKLIRRIPTPTAAEIRQITEERYLPQSTLDVLLDLPPVGTYISRQAFRDGMKTCHAALLKQWFVWGQIHNYMGRGEAEIAALRCYHDVKVELGNDPDGTVGSRDYIQWFTDKAIPYANYTSYECGVIAQAILTQCTGADLTDEKSLVEIQAALIRLMARLSSYTVQWIVKINESHIRVADLDFVQHTDPIGASADEFAIEALDVGVRCVTGWERDWHHLPVYEDDWETKFSIVHHDAIEYNVNIDTEAAATQRFTYRIPLSEVYLFNADAAYSNFEDDTPVRETQEYQPLGYQDLADAFLTLSTPHYQLTPGIRAELQARWFDRTSDLDGKTSFRDAHVTTPALLGGYVVDVRPPQMQDSDSVTTPELVGGVVVAIPTASMDDDASVTHLPCWAVVFPVPRKVRSNRMPR